MPRPEQHEEFVKNELNPGALEAALRYEVDGEIRFDSGSKALYSTDASNYRQIPIGVVIPRTKEAVVKTVEVCRRFGAPVVSRGGGTGLCGQTCNVAVVIDHSKYRNRILELDPEKKIARVEPGCILDHLRDAAEKHHLTFAPDPATHTHNTLGGMIGNNSCGVHAVMGGKTVDNMIEMEVLTYDGLVLTVGETSDQEIESIISEGGRRAEIYKGLRDLRDIYAPLIRQRYPKIPRRVSGYNLDDLLPEKGFNVARALVGSESTCITVLEATLRLMHSPPERALVVFGYPSVYEAGDHIPEILDFGPIGLEGLDDTLIHYMKKKGMHPKEVKLLPEGNGWLMTEFGGETREEAEKKAYTAMDALKKKPNPPSMKLFDDKEEEKKIWSVRESGLGATANVPGQPLMWDGWEDAAVDPARLGDYLREFRDLLHKHGYEASLYGHFGGGCIHCRIPFDLFTHEGLENWWRFLDEASDLVVKYGGSFSAEHGDGQSKAIFLPKMYGPELIEAFHIFKSLWDPEWKMNPGKIVDPYTPLQNLRLGTSYNPWQPQTHFKFPEDNGSFSRATLRCVGVGECRRTHDAFMCPSFLATREERHTTRGRAHTLFELFEGEVITDGWRSKEVFEALRLCLACKGCKVECPVNVDMATWKAEFLSHYYEKRLRPRAAYSMGLIGLWGPLGRKVPRIANFFSQTPLLRDVAKGVAGVSKHRSMPKFADESFSAWFARRGGPTHPQGKRVLLYPDIFNDCFFPESLKAAVEVLEHWDFRVEVPQKSIPAVRPPIHYGMLKLAKKNIVKAVGVLHPYAADGVDIVVLEPSTAAVYRDEAPMLFPGRADVMRVQHHVMLLGEFIVKHKLDLPRLHGKAVFHAHCHQKAVLDPNAARKVLKAMGLDFDEPQPGCCGMAGSFGFESENYELSMQIGEEHLLPAVKKSPLDAWIVADGFSCRTQIKEGTGREALHMAELLREAFNSGMGTVPGKHLDEIKVGI